MKSPAFSFYVRDWLCSNTVSKLHSKSYSKHGSNLCSRGINAYLFLLLQSWLQEPSGTLPSDDVELCDLARVTPEEWTELKPLIMPCFKENGSGRIYNERLMVEVIKQQNRSKAGSKGGNTKEANRVAALENENENENEIAFEQFWAAYPRKVGKGDARKSWRKIEGVPSLLTKILSSIAAQKKWPQWTKDGGQFIPHPSTWLNQKRWLDGGIEPPEETVGGRF